MSKVLTISGGVASFEEVDPLDVLLECRSRRGLKAVWLEGLTEGERDVLRSNAVLAAHVWSVLQKDPA